VETSGSAVGASCTINTRELTCRDTILVQYRQLNCSYIVIEAFSILSQNYHYGRCLYVLIKDNSDNVSILEYIKEILDCVSRVNKYEETM
jgi:hypothetical protein